MQTMFRIDERSVNNTSTALYQIAHNALPWAVRSTLNDLAFEAREEGMKEIEKKFINRNTFTRNRVYVNKANQKRISAMVAETGHLLDYMAIQENGGYVAPKTGHIKRIVTNEARIGKNFLKVTRLAYRMGNIEVGVKGSKYFVGSVSGSKKGLFVRKGTRRKPNIQMLYDLSHSRVYLDDRPWLEPSSRRVATSSNIARLYRRNAERVIGKIEDRYGVSIGSIAARTTLGG